jgi:Flp pilus assembly protein TadD
VDRTHGLPALSEDPRQLYQTAKGMILAGDPQRALPLVERAVQLAPRESAVWDLMGFCQARLGAFEPSLGAHRRALELAPHPPQAALFVNFFNSMRVLQRLQMADEALCQGLAVYPRDPAMTVERAGIFRATGRLAEAEQVLEESLATNPGNPQVLLELGMFYEQSNRLEALDALLGRIGDLGTSPELNLLKVWQLRRQKRLAEAAKLLHLCTLARAAPLVERVRAELAEEHGDHAEAFARFAAMNQAILDNSILRDTDGYRLRIEREREAMQPRPGPPIPFTGKMPAFVIGSPRSGTTLLDTFLSAHPAIVVGEELHMREQIENEFPGLDRATDPDLIARARARYFAIAEQALGPIGERLLVDKHPLHTPCLPLIDRLFPGAPIVLVERHPCAVTFSCFSTPFQSNAALRSYSTLEGAALTYDAMFGHMQRARELLPLNLHELRYERLIADPKVELGALIGFLGLEWSDDLLDHRAAAARRGQVQTASYAQIHQPLDAFAKERWRKYSAQMEPVMPILKPWIERMGYEA